jgi:hypothetical protein
MISGLCGLFSERDRPGGACGGNSPGFEAAGEVERGGDICGGLEPLVNWIRSAQPRKSG